MMLGILMATAGQATSATPQAPNLFSALLPFILVFAIFYLLIILPSRKKQKKHQDMVNNLKPGDRIITTGGIYGTIMGVQKDRLEVKIAANTKIDITRSAIGAILGPSETAEAKD
jgi:preprotein translocase subunit YajC